MHFTLKRYTTHYRALVSLGVPIVVGQIGNVVLGFADTLMIGHHSMMELAAASFVTTMFTLIVIFAMASPMVLRPSWAPCSAAARRKRLAAYCATALPPTD